MTKDPLTYYEYSTESDITGTKYRETITPLDDQHAQMTVMSKYLFSGAAQNTKYLIDASVLREIERVFRKNRMFLWNNRRLNRNRSDLHRKEYIFCFGVRTATYVIYTDEYLGRYGKVVGEIRDIMKKCYETQIKIEDEAK